MNIEKYKIGQQVAICGFIEEINIENLRDIENTTHLVINTLTRTIDANPKYETVIIDPTSLKPLVPQYVANWVDDSREYDYDFDEWFDCNSQPDEIYKWLNCKNKRQSELNALALVTLIVNGRDAVTVEKEPRYTVKLKNQEGYEDYLVKTNSSGYRFYNNIYTDRRIHTRKELESNGFGWVFDCEGIEVEEVE
ncbi:unnamed protein product [Streptococcus phage TP-778L]|uniref:DUF1642 domain-containing protein n=1 Tax=Streptococcus phage TP-778L TaxID=1385385 RepID=U6E993_9CAUD|nr:hypothetical protein V442_gp19 [Streptococcus phage TP-778L]CDG41648.1 unnamed protein product [Streptococcus phage TP-778L]